MKTKYIIVFLFLSNFFIAFSQNTIGVINNTQDSYNGYTLYTIFKNTYLINNCGEVVNQWVSNYNPGNSVYLLENGNLLRACQIDNPDVNIGGAGGRVELYNWDGALLWGYNYSTNQVRQHHEVIPIPNSSNVLLLAITIMTNQEAIQAGRNPADLAASILFNEQIIEIEPTGATTGDIVWEWNINDHLIQDFDNTKDNFGIVADHPELLDINYLGASAGNSNWLHVNSMQYNEALDQIIFSSRLLSEIFIIDHSTTTLEASSHTGGTYGKGGDFLYRWGNPESYDHGTSADKILFGQHYPHFIPEGLPNAGKIILFNNGAGRTPEFSEVFILTPPTTAPGVYSYTANVPYGPAAPDYIYTDPTDVTNFFSAFLSGARVLPNGNILICSGPTGYFFEIDDNNNKVWEYIAPFNGVNILAQGESSFANPVFRAIRYAPDYPAFDGRDLTPGNTIETGTPLYNCSILNIEKNEQASIKVYPNPVRDELFIKTKYPLTKIEVYDMLGNLVKTSFTKEQVNLSDLASSLYILKIYSNEKSITKKIVKL